MKDEITITTEQFRDRAADVAAELAIELENKSGDASKGIEILLLTALFSAKLHKVLFDDDELEVEE